MTQQLPEEEKQKVFDSLMAVSERIYLGPIESYDLIALQWKAAQNNFALKEYRKGRDLSAILIRKPLIK